MPPLLTFPVRSPGPVSLFPVITTPSLANATVGVAYSLQLFASFGTPPYTWSIISASPNTGNWLSLSAGGLLTGTPGTAETEALTLQVTDTNGRTGNSPFTLLVITAGGGGSGLVHGQEVTITGSGFGTKSRGLSPILEDHGQGALGTADPQWTWAFGQSANPIYIPYNMVLRALPWTPVSTVISKPHSHVGAIYGGAHYQGGGFYDYDVFLQKQLALPAVPNAGSECCIYSRVYMRGLPETTGLSSSNNHKLWYYQPAAQQLTNSIYFTYAVGNPANNTSAGFQGAMGDNQPPVIIPANGLDRTGTGHYTFNNVPNVNSAAVGWFLLEMELCASSVAGAGGKGYLKVWANGVPLLNWQERTDAYAGTTRYWGFGCYNNNYPNPTNWEIQSDHLIDMTGVGVVGAVAKVIWGNTSTLATSTIRAAMRNYTTWNDTTIKGPFPQDRFTSSMTAYAHVVAESGAVLNNQGSGVVA